jgi:hypothetical protein
MKIRQTLFGLVGKRVVLTLKDRNLFHSGPPFRNSVTRFRQTTFSFRGQLA